MSDIDALLDDVASKRYFLRYNEGHWVEVDKEVWVRAERAAGFVNTMGQPAEPGTAGFGSHRGNVSVEGTIVDMRHARREAYVNWRRDLADLVWPDADGTETAV